MTKIGEQKMIVAASPTGSRAKPIKMHVTVMQPIRPVYDWENIFNVANLRKNCKKLYCFFK